MKIILTKKDLKKRLRTLVLYYDFATIVNSQMS